MRQRERHARRARSSGGLGGAINHARTRPVRIPRIVSPSYPEFHSKQVAALKIGVVDLEEKIASATGIARIELDEEKLTFFPFLSQSKLSQQELSDLQKATHFDKKELQQWYKGESHHNHNRAPLAG